MTISQNKINTNKKLQKRKNKENKTMPVQDSSKAMDQMQAQQRQMQADSIRMNQIQMETNRISQESTATSNSTKSAHDAMMAILQNIK